MRGHRTMRDGGIKVDALDYGAPFQVMHSVDKYQVWHKRSSVYCSERGYPPRKSPALYLLVRVEGKQHEVIREEEPGYKWRKIKAELIAQCDALARGE